ncbi:MAG: FecR domain-containing protein [Candidatus Acidiferrales bacterium]|jgi:hypothetical protein
MQNQQHTPAPHPKISRIEVYWTAVTYKTVAIYLILIFAVVMATLYLVYPEWYGAAVTRVERAMGAGANPSASLAQNQARFVNLDGRVQVKKANSVQWADADYRFTLDKGDLIQTGPDGAARITFVDGTTFTVKPNTLVTVEQNSVARDSSTRVGMRISSGAVDLTTGTWQSPQSKAEVSFSNAVASLHEDSRAAVRSDPATQDNEITVAAGGAELQRGDEHVDIGKYERASLPAEGGPIVKTAVLAPPDLSEPVNLQPLIDPDPKHLPIHFAWSAVPDAVSYDLKIGMTAMFSRIAVEKHITGTSVDVAGLDPGDYYWSVTATDSHKHESAPSEAYKFTLVAEGKGEDMLLEVDGTELHGNVVEVIGRTEPGAALIIDGESVADISPDGHFRFFTQPMARGSQTIVVTGQNRRGGTNIKRVTIVIP